MLNEDCPVLYYKGQEEDDNETSLKQSDFVLILMTSFQEQQINRFGGDKLCIDGTHGTNAYDIQLYTLMVIDDFSNGCPVAYCFSNRSDEYIFNLFFDKIKKKVGYICTRIFMSDDAPAFYNAWLCIMGNVEHRLLCTWHVDKNWRKNLNKICGGQEKKILVYKTLRALLQISDINKFEESLHKFLEDLYADLDTKEFAQYFEAHYVNRPQTWAYCYRVGLGINTNMYLESFHKVLKHIYLEGKKVKRLDKTINAVLKYTRDCLFKRAIKLIKKAPNERIQRIKNSHKLSENIVREMIEHLEDEEQKSWLVQSSSSTDQKYRVIQVGEKCPDACIECTMCQICVHMFKCCCIDSMIRLNICKHIHACAREYYGGIENINNNVISPVPVEKKKHR